MIDPLPTSLSLLLIFVFIMMNSFFVAAEFAMVKVRGSRLDTIIADGDSRAKLASHMTGNLDAYLSACQLGITLASLGLGWVGGPAIANVIKPAMAFIGIRSEWFVHAFSFLLAFILITMLQIVLGELAPKTIAIRKAESITRLTALPLVCFYKLIFPFIWLFNGVANLLLRKIELSL